jgi:nitroreductase
LRAIAYGQPKVEEAAVTFVIFGVLPDAATLPERLLPSVEAGYMPADMPSVWQAGVSAQYGDARIARDEAVRSATFAAATLIFAAEALGLVSGPMVGFDAEALAREFGLGPNEVPIMLVAVGRAAPGNWPQKPRRPLAEVLEIS